MGKFNNYLDAIWKTSEKYLKKTLSAKEIVALVKNLQTNKKLETEECIRLFNEKYTSLIKKKHQLEYKKSDVQLNRFLDNTKSNCKIVWGDCLNVLKKMKSESIHMMVTSPPYFNAREYSQWKNINEYLDDMREIIKETYRVLDNHRVWVFNVGDIFDNPKNIF